MSHHTIVLLQANSKPASRQYSDFENEEKAMDGQLQQMRDTVLPQITTCNQGQNCICQIFEQKLKAENPNTKKITYDISDLYTFIDSLTDLATLVFDSRINAYVPHNKAWIKERVFAHLKKQAGQ